MSVVRVMQMTIHQIVDMVPVRHAFVAARRSVCMSGLVTATDMLRRAGYRIIGAGRDLMVIHMIAMDVVEVAIVKIIRMPLVLYGGVSTIRTVGVAMSFVLYAGHVYLSCRS